MAIRGGDPVVTHDLVQVAEGTTVSVCIVGGDHPVSGELVKVHWDDDGAVLVIDGTGWLYRVPVKSVTAWATYERRY